MQPRRPTTSLIKCIYPVSSSQHMRKDSRENTLGMVGLTTPKVVWWAQCVSRWHVFNAMEPQATSQPPACIIQTSGAKLEGGNHGRHLCHWPCIRRPLASPRLISVLVTYFQGFPWIYSPQRWALTPYAWWGGGGGDAQWSTISIRHPKVSRRV